MTKKSYLIGVAWLFIAATVLAEPIKEDEAPFLLSFVVGDYAIVGQYPDSSEAYSGVATIKREKNSLRLTRQIGSSTIKADGRVEVPQPPGEGSIIRFRWSEKDTIVMTCLVSSDIDNYPRLTCYWIPEGRTHTRPGIEAMFPTAAWPKVSKK